MSGNCLLSGIDAEKDGLPEKYKELEKATDHSEK